MGKTYEVTKKQHFHMRHILDKFSDKGDLVILEKNSTELKPAKTTDSIFLADSAWSQELEGSYSRKIERRIVGQISHILKEETVCDHPAISNYHLLWKLRHHYALSPGEKEQYYEGYGAGEMDPALKQMANYLEKLPINPDGSIDAMFSVTQKIKIGFENYIRQYRGIKWEILKSSTGGFISADCYDRSLIFPISPSVLLLGKHKASKRPVEATPEQIELYNNAALDQCSLFCFSAKP